MILLIPVVLTGLWPTQQGTWHRQGFAPCNFPSLLCVYLFRHSATCRLQILFSSIYLHFLSSRFFNRAVTKFVDFKPYGGSTQANSKYLSGISCMMSMQSARRMRFNSILIILLLPSFP